MYDVFIIGAGPAGMEAAKMLARKGKKVVLAEQRDIGGTCLNRGCIPLKVFLHTAKIFETSKRSYDKGIQVESVKLNLKNLVKYKNNKVIQLRNNAQLELQQLGVDILRGHAIISEKTDEYFAITVETTAVRAKKIIIATGTSAVKMEIGKELKYSILDSDQFLDLENIPSKVVIVGGGVIGLEAASFLQMVGSEVTVIEKADHIAGSIDREISEQLKRNFERKGVKFFLDIDDIEFLENEVKYIKNGKENFIATDCVLISIGRTPNLDGWGMEQLNLQYNNRGIIVDNNYCTTCAGVYACGDVVGHHMLAHEATRQAKVVVNAILCEEDCFEENEIPLVLYCNPEVASVGESEESCLQKGIDYITRTISMLYSSRYFVENSKDNCICKMLVERTSNKIIGFHIMGNSASEIITSVSVMLKNNMTLAEAKKIVFPHPTVGEGIMQLLDLF